MDDEAGEKERTELMRAKLAAENASIAKSRYLANVSHEILLATQRHLWLCPALSSAATASMLREAARAVLVMLGASCQSGRGPARHVAARIRRPACATEEVRFGPFMDQIVSMMRPSALSKGLVFRYEPPERMPDVVRLDPSRFRQVLINLLSNAIKFTEHGSVTLKVGYAAQTATFEVRDTGPGIRAEDHERIERFEQARGAA